ncbi:MAG: SCO family protein, partial [Actinobacteria bacterium]|nr:SCO family protein [Actinomycetota bacterium]
MSRLKYALLLPVLLGAGCGAAPKEQTQIETPTQAPKRFAGAELAPPRAAPPIALQDARGARVTLTGQRGRYVLVTFLYVHCPDVCPLIAQNLNQTLRQLGPKRDRVRVLA